MAVEISNIRTERLPKRFLGYIQNTGPYQGDTELFGRLFTKVMKWRETKGLAHDQNTEAITVYHDDPEQVSENQQTISVGFTVPEGTTTSDDIQIMELPEALYLVGTFEIHPHEYGAAWNQVFEYIKNQNLKLTMHLMYESYRNEPHTHPEGKHIVDICIALEK